MRHLLVYASLLAFGLSGCISTASFYTPPAVNVPLLYRQGQATAEASSGIGVGQYSSSAAADLSGSYSPIPHVAVLANYHWFNSSYGQGGSTIDNQDNNARMGELGIGGYMASDDEKVKLIADIYGGGGFGKLSSHGIMNGSMNMSRMFLQPGVGMRTNIVDLALNLRFSGVTYNYASSVLGFAPNSVNSYEIPPANGSFNLFVEPSFTLRLGYKFLKLHTQMTFAHCNTNWNYDDFVFNIGLHFNLEYLQKGFYDRSGRNMGDRKNGMQ